MRHGILAVLLLLPAMPLDAHPLNVGYAEIALHEREVVVALSLNLFELDLLLALDRNLDARVDREELAAKQAAILDYLRGKISVSAGGEVLPMAAGPVGIGRGTDGKPLLEATLAFRSTTPLTALTIRSEPLSELGADHTLFAKITDGGQVEQFVFRSGAVYDRRVRGFWEHAIQFLGAGVHHIFLGYDHVAFLLGLLLMGGSLLNIVKIVTAFTLAHSLTLCLATLDLVTLPARLVEVGIALSIAYVALENLFFATFDRRWLVSFAFGLVHGFGFANVLKEMHLPTSGLAASLLFFNIGVEVGQILVVVLVVPLLWGLSRTPVHRATVKVLSVALLSAGVFWLFHPAV
jgi:hypothetical protein